MVINNNAKITSEFSENFISLYCHFLYKYFGRPLLRVKKFRRFFDKSIYNSKYESYLKKANLKMIPEEYFISIFLTIVGGLGLSIILTFFFLTINPLYAILVFYGGTILFMAIGLFFYNYPIIVAKSRGDEIDAAIVYLLPYLKILAQEISLTKMIEIIDDFLIYKEIKVEFNRITYYKDFLGYDIHSAIREAMQSCPSHELADLLNDMVTISNSGGNIYNYFDRKLSNLEKEIESIEKKNIETLLIYSQIYVVILLIAPLFYTVMSSILSLVNFSASGSSAAGGSDSMSSIILLLFFLPLAYIAFMMLIYYSKPLYSRLEPIEGDN
ncbi:MAG: type II secretion system F family protein [Nanoarchaeales archaeon]|nr:type II secretion system F family protein [Nanoarchaeales archaeon]